MKKVYAFLATSSLMAFGLITDVMAQAPAKPVAPVVEQSYHQLIKETFIAGGIEFMIPILLCLIIGLALAIERIITLNLETTNTKKFLPAIEEALKSGGTVAAKDVAVNTPGAVASIFTQGLMRADEGLDAIEKSVVSYGSVMMGRLEKGLTWISLFIGLAPMLGFMGTVYGMILAFKKIQSAGTMDASLMAGEIQVALITTIGGLIVAIILQIFYNYLTAKIDSITNQMEDSSITLMDMLVKKQAGNLK